MGMNPSLRRTYGRTLRGLRAYGERPYLHGQNVTVLGAIALKGFLGAMTVEGGTNSEVFRVFVEQILVPCLWKGAVVVMDNLPAHKVKYIQDIIESSGARVIFLPPYSPDFNRA
jgi:transposase